MWLILRFQAVRLTEGIKYYTFDVFFISADVLPSPGGLLGKALKWIDRIIPDADIMEYLPHTLLAGQDVGGYIVPETIYLLGAEMFGGFGSDARESWFFGGAEATYTQYPPNEEGIIFLPDFDFPPPATWYEVEMPYGSTWHSSPGDPSPYEIRVASRHNGTQDSYPRKTRFLANFLWLYSGYSYNPGHFISHLEEFALESSTPGILGDKYLRLDNVVSPAESVFIQPAGPPPDGIVAVFSRTAAYGDEYTLILQVLSEPAIFLPGPEEPPSPDNGIISPLVGIVSAIVQSGFSGMDWWKRFRLATPPYEDFQMDNENFQMDNENFQTREM